MKSVLLTLTIIAFLCCCSSRTKTVATVLTQPWDSNTTYSISKTEEVSDSAISMRFFFPFFELFVDGCLKEAVEKAVKKAGPNCAGLSHAEVKWSFFTFLIYAQHRIHVKGRPIYKK